MPRATESFAYLENGENWSVSARLRNFKNLTRYSVFWLPVFG